jgi:hypothetical protein
LDPSPFRQRVGLPKRHSQQHGRVHVGNHR